jgi:hypothetical protein
MKPKRIPRWLVPPGVDTALTYERAWLWPDLRAGIVLTALLIPAGMGYAEVAGLPPETGLYATIVPLLVYAVFGPSKILVIGPDSALAPIIAAVGVRDRPRCRVATKVPLTGSLSRNGHLQAVRRVAGSASGAMLNRTPTRSNIERSHLSNRRARRAVRRMPRSGDMRFSQE